MIVQGIYPAIVLLIATQRSANDSTLFSVDGLSAGEPRQSSQLTSIRFTAPELSFMATISQVVETGAAHDTGELKDQYARSFLYIEKSSQ